MEPETTETQKGRPAVLFVCTANMIRSPMAAALFLARLKKDRDDWQIWRIDSAGTWALDGEGASRNARAVMTQRGIDLSGHRAKTVSAGLLNEFDLILVMEQGHKEALQVEFPRVADRVFLLSEMAGAQYPIDDPVGRPVKDYEETAQKIDQLLARSMQRIISLAESRRASLETE